MPPADVGLGVFLRLRRLLAQLQFPLVQARLQHREGGGAVLVLRAVALALHHDAGRDVGDTDRTVGLVDVLAAGARSPVGVDAQVLFLVFHLDLVIDHGIDPYRGKAGVAPGLRIERRDAHQPVHAAFVLQPAIGVRAGDLQRGRFQPGFFASTLFQPFDLVVMLFRPACVHARQHQRPVLCLGAAGAGMHFEIAVIAVRLARQQAFQLLLGRDLAQPGQHLLGLGDDILVTLHLAEFDQLQRIVQLALNGAIAFDALFQLGALAQQFLRLVAVVPQIGVGREGIQLVEPGNRTIPVKDASSAAPTSL